MNRQPDKPTLGISKAPAGRDARRGSSTFQPRPFPSTRKCPLSSHPEGVSMQRSHHGHEEQLLQQSEHGTDEGLKACQCPEVIGREPEGDSQESEAGPPLSPAPTLLPPQTSLHVGQEECCLKNSSLRVPLGPYPPGSVSLQNQQAEFNYLLSVWSTSLCPTSPTSSRKRTSLTGFFMLFFS